MTDAALEMHTLNASVLTNEALQPHCQATREYVAHLPLVHQFYYNYFVHFLE